MCVGGGGGGMWQWKCVCLYKSNFTQKVYYLGRLMISQKLIVENYLIVCLYVLSFFFLRFTVLPEYIIILFFCIELERKLIEWIQTESVNVQTYLESV